MDLDTKKADFFISHASEDKDGLVRELAHSLMLNGALVFYDEYSIKLGDSLSDSINKGIANANHAVIILSKFFFEKSWTNAELQSLFNKSLREGFKLLIIYHEVKYLDVALKYPLLADLKGIDSSAGVPKITEALFEAINKKATNSYLTSDFELEENLFTKGFSISLFVGFPNFANQQFEKVLFDLGTKDVFKSRIRLTYINNRVYFEIIDTLFHKIAISTDVSSWKLGEQKFLHADFSLEKKRIYLFVENQMVDNLSFDGFLIDNSFLRKATMIIGNSLELRNPCQFIVGMNALGQSMDLGSVQNMSNAMKTYMQAISKL